MEYRRRTRRRRNRRSQSSGGGAKLLLTILILGGAVYLISASAAGTWLAQNVMAPIFEAFSGKSASSTYGDNNVIQTGSDSNAASTSNDSTQAKLSGLDVYLIQMGVYSSKDNALESAEAIKKKGAGGYVMQDGDSYRVFASAYATRDEARSVRDNLKADGMEAAVHQISLEGAAFNVTADNESRQAISEGFSCLYDAAGNMMELSQEFDKDELSVKDGLEKLKPIIENVNSKYTALSKTGSGDAVMKNVENCFSAYKESLEALSKYNGTSTSEFSSQIKYTALELIDEYAGLLRGFKA